VRSKRISAVHWQAERSVIGNFVSAEVLQAQRAILFLKNGDPFV